MHRACRFSNRASAGEFSWAQYRRNREYQAALGVLAGIAALWAIMMLRGSKMG
jgi:hypothetical protein